MEQKGNVLKDQGPRNLQGAAQKDKRLFQIEVLHILRCGCTQRPSRSPAALWRVERRQREHVLAHGFKVQTPDPDTDVGIKLCGWQCRPATLEVPQQQVLLVEDEDICKRGIEPIWACRAPLCFQAALRHVTCRRLTYSLTVICWKRYRGNVSEVYHRAHRNDASLPVSRTGNQPPLSFVTHDDFSEHHLFRSG